ncbi:hypothetical protein [uncultured Pseudoteredinibacter sp.]|uniref:hypothetical protein n=1 Tax=uncultured Pseudoteredinibacter sp. TaxID=1641701 RepID=UPI00262EF219|nr:hypothetical protein [uncultured Pseudoteredinibacter sp.]
MNKDVQEFIGARQSTAYMMVILSLGSVSVWALPQIVETFQEGGFVKALSLIAILAFISGLAYYFAPKLSPKKSIRVNQKTLSMRQDGAIHWRIELSDIGQCDISRREETAFKDRSKMLNVHNKNGEKLIEQEVEFLAAEQQRSLLKLLLHRVEKI